MFCLLLRSILSDVSNDFNIRIPAGSSKTSTYSKNLFLVMVKWDNCFLEITLNQNTYCILPSYGYTMFQFKDSVTIKYDARGSSSDMICSGFYPPIENGRTYGCKFYVTNKAQLSITDSWTTDGTRWNLCFYIPGKYTMTGKITNNAPWGSRPEMYYCLWDSNTITKQDGSEFEGPFQFQYQLFFNNYIPLYDFKASDLKFTNSEAIAPTIPLTISFSIEDYIVNKFSYDGNFAITDNDKDKKDITSFPITRNYNCYQGDTQKCTIYDTKMLMAPSNKVIKMIDYTEHNKPDWLKSKCSIEEIIINKYVGSIGSYSFADCSTLQKIDVSKATNLLTIGSYAFKGCTTLQTISSNSFEIINEYAFLNCDSLNFDTFSSNNFKRINHRAFSGCSLLKKFEISSKLEFVAASAFIDTHLEEFISNEENNAFLVDTNALFSKDCTKLIAIPPKSAIILYTIPDTVHTISPYAFYQCSLLKSIVIPKLVVAIDEYTFYACSSLSIVDIQGQITSIGQYAFYECISLYSISIPNSIEVFGVSAFEGCINLEPIQLPQFSLNTYDGIIKYTLNHENNQNGKEFILEKTEDSFTAILRINCHGWFTISNEQKAECGSKYDIGHNYEKISLVKEESQTLSSVVLPKLIENTEYIEYTISFDLNDQKSNYKQLKYQSSNDQSLNDKQSNENTQIFDPVKVHVSLKYGCTEWKTNDNIIAGKSGESYTPLNYSPIIELTAELTKSSEIDTQLILPTPEKKEVLTCIISYDLNGGVGHNPDSTINKTIITTFNGWFSNSIGGINYGKGGDQFQPESLTEDMTLFAQWGESQSSLSQLILPVPNYFYSGRKFVNWNTEKNGNGKKYEANSVLTDFESMTLYAQWMGTTDGFNSYRDASS